MKKGKRDYGGRKQNKFIKFLKRTVIFLILISIALGILGALTDEAENKADKNRKGTSTESVAETTSSSQKQELTDTDKKALEEYFTETMQEDSNGYLVRWESMGEDYSVMTLTFKQEVKYMSNADKQYLMDTIGKKYDNLRQSIYIIGNHMHIKFLTEDGTKIGESKLMSPTVYKLK